MTMTVARGGPGTGNIIHYISIYIYMIIYYVFMYICILCIYVRMMVLSPVDLCMSWNEATS